MKEEKRFLEILNSSLDDILNGNFSSVKDKIKEFEEDDDLKESIDKISKLSDTLNYLIEDSNTMNEAAKLGKLDVRIDANKYQGDFAKITNGFNDTVDKLLQI